MKSFNKKLCIGLIPLTLSACGGGGGGGAIGSVSDFVQEDLSSLTGSESIISSYSSLLSGFNSTISSGNLAGLSAIITGPTEKDITKAGNLLTMLNQAETLWSQTINLIESQDADTKLKIYNSDDYKNAHAAVLYLQYHVKPVIQKVSQGQKLSLTEYNKVASDIKAEQIIKEEKESTVETYVVDKKTKINEEKQIKIAKKIETKEEEIKEEEKKEKVKEDVKEEVKEENKLEVKEVTKVEPTNVEVDVREGYSHLDVTYGDTVVTTEELVTTEDGHTVTTLVTHSTRAVFHEHYDYKDTVTITTYKDGTVKEDVVRVTTGRGKVEKPEEITTTKKELNRVLIVAKESETPKEPVVEEVVKEKKESAEVVKVEEVKIEVIKEEKTKKEEVKEAVIKEDKKEVVKTFGHQFRTTEFNKDTSKSIINADKAYARGWTGKGAVLGIIDSYQQTDHEALNGKYKWYNNYVRYKDGTKDANGNELGTLANGGKYISHGTHVAGIIAGKKDNTEFHGVAFDAELVGANIDYHGSGLAHMSYAANAIQDIAKLKSSNAQGGEGINVVAINMSINKSNPNFHYGTVTQLSDGTYSAPKISNIMQYSGGGAQYWQVATDNDIILVNSAGNGLYINGSMNYDYALDPGVWATQTDNNGNLVLGGKMIIVGNWGGTKADGQVVGSKAGHICLKIVNNACNDTYKTSDFYILAPGNSVFSSAPDNGYLTMGGSSMAAPQVTGALGILHQMWPHMKGENLVKLVLNTADSSINGYNVNIHGQGMLDLDEATKPQGVIGIPTTGRVDGTLTSVNNTYFATGSSSAFSSLSNLKIMIIDDYDRDYYLNLASGLTIKDNRKYSDVDMLMANNDTFLPTQQMYGSFTQGGQYNLFNNYNVGFYTGENGGGDYSMNVGKNFMLHKNFKLKTRIGQMSEQDTWLGNYSNGILAVGDNNDTNFGNIGFEYALGNKILSLDYSKGYTDVNTTEGSLIKGFSDIETESYRLAYETHKDKHTSFGWSFSLPSHITSGSMDLEVAESINLDGTINYTNFNSNLAQTTKEKNLGFFYNKTPEHDLDATFKFSAEYRQDVSGQDGADGINLAMNYVKKFNIACGFFIWKNSKCYNTDGSKKNMKDLYASKGNKDQLTRHKLVYDLETDKFVPIRKNND